MSNQKNISYKDRKRKKFFAACLEKLLFPTSIYQKIMILDFYIAFFVTSPVEHARQETVGSDEIPMISWQQYSGERIQWPDLFGFSGNRQEPATTGQLYTVTGSLHRILNILRRGSCQILHVSSRFSREMHGNTAARKH